MQKINEVVVTGYGVNSPLGNESDELWRNLLQKKSGVVSTEKTNPELFAMGARVAAMIEDLDVKKLDLPRKWRKSLNLQTKMTLSCGAQALSMAGYDIPLSDNFNVGVILGSGNVLCDRHCVTSVLDRNPKWFFDIYPNLFISYLSIFAGLKGYGSTLVNACSSGTQAIGHAYHLIKYGECEALLAGGIEDKLRPNIVSGFNRLNMITNDEDPDTASRPFDKSRNGFVIGQGGAMLMLESMEHAKRRGAKILAKVVGYGMSLDAKSLTDASKDGKYRAMEMALNSSGLEIGDIDYINAHGTSTQSNDEQEYLAIQELFNVNKPFVNSSKSMIGHCFAASGAIESIICIKSLEDQILHPNKNIHEIPDGCNINLVPDHSIKSDLKYCMNNSSGIGGFNSSVIFERYEEGYNE